MEKLRHEWPLAGFDGLPSLDEIGAVAAPVHIVRATGTTLAAATVVALLRRVLPQATYSEIEGAGHMSPVTHPNKVNPLVAAFLDRHR